MDSAAKDKELVTEMEDEIRVEALKLYAADSSTKDLGAGVTIAEIKSYEYPLEKRMSYVEVYAIACITPASINEKAWNALCRSDELRPPFVKEVLTPQARIAQDLGAALKKDGA